CSCHFESEAFIANWCVIWPLRVSGKRSAATRQASASLCRAIIPIRTPVSRSPARTSSSSDGGFGYFTAMAPLAFAADIPHAEDPERRKPGWRFEERGGPNLALLIL